MPQATPGNRMSWGQKRKRVGTALVKSSQSPRLKPLQTEKEEDLAYWDTLSKLWLTPCALRELDRRNEKSAGPDRIATSCKPVGEPDLTDYQPQQLKKFARYGGPDLCDLRGVCLALRFVKLNANSIHLVSGTRHDKSLQRRYAME